MYDAPVIDCDVHVNFATDEDLLSRLPRRWRDYAYMPGGGRSVSLHSASIDTGHPTGTNKRLDAFPETGHDAGSDYKTMCEQLLDPHRVETAVFLTDVGLSAIANEEFAAAACRAWNDWVVEEWFEATGDRRLSAGLLVPAHDPAAGAEEIRRAGRHPGFASAFIDYNALGKPLGHPLYHPIYAAAAEMDLPVHLHICGGEFMGGTASLVSGGGMPLNRFGVYTLISQPITHHLTSMIVHGVFEKFPTLRIINAETGLWFLPWLFARLDSNYELMRRESVWMKKRPSEYLREHMKFTTQPCESFRDDKSEMIEQLSLIEGIEDMLCFSSDYPHWDTDVPSYIDSVLPSAWHSRVFHDNASATLRRANGGASR